VKARAQRSHTAAVTKLSKRTFMRRGQDRVYDRFVGSNYQQGRESNDSFLNSLARIYHH
jgi:hypothetical protein